MSPRSKPTSAERTQAILDQFYKERGPCCAGCDWWCWHNAAAGECIRTVPVAGHERLALLGVTWTSYPVQAGHIMTPRDHVCGEFCDSEQTPKGTE